MWGNRRSALAILIAAALVLGVAASAEALTSAPDDRSAKARAATARPHYLFDDEFNGRAHAPPNAKKWIVNDSCRGFTDTKSCPSTANVFQNGSGQLVLRIKRTASGASGALLATYDYGADWPNRASKVRASFSLPYKISMRARMPSTSGAWSALWLYNVDRKASQHNYEIDVAEERMTFPTSAGCHAHDWVNAHDVNPWDGGLRVTNMATNWHIYSAVVARNHVSYYVDGKSCGTSSAVSGAQGVILDSVLGQRGSWGSGGGAPRKSDRGPWDMLVDYVRVTRA